MKNVSPWGQVTGIRPVKLARNLLAKGASESDVLSFFYNWDVLPEKATLALEIAKRQMPLLAPLSSNHIGLYIGIPFCRSKCLYCSFVTNTADQSSHLVDAFVDALVTEIAYTGALLAKTPYKIATVYIGGGTPTTLEPAALQRIFDACHAAFCLDGVMEFTVEAGRPDTITAQKLAVLKQNNVGRICINPQTMNDQTLRLIGRQHTVEQTEQSVAMARQAGFGHINMDVIAGLPGETLCDFRHTIERVQALCPESITVHTLSLKRGSHLLEKLDAYSLSDEQAAAMVDYAHATLQAGGKLPYYLYRQKNMLGSLENVGYAKEGSECLYNIMMMEETSTIVSVGSGAVTKYVSPDESVIKRAFNVKEVNDYIARIDEMCERKRALFEEIQGEAQKNV